MTKEAIHDIIDRGYVVKVKIKLNKKQIAHVAEITGITYPKAAIKYFAELMVKENIDPTKMAIYVDRMMKKEEEND